jgi:hypothetical protein
MLALRLPTLVLLSCFGFASGNTVVWPVDSLIKVFPDDVAGSNRNPSDLILLPRNGHATLQLAVRSDAPVLDLKITTIFAGPVDTEVRHVGYVPVHKNTPDSPLDELVRKAPARFPDPLLEDMPFSIPANETNAVWITFHAGPHADPGDYTGRAVFRSAARAIATVSFHVRVMRA